jgi:hypothetical protein
LRFEETHLFQGGEREDSFVGEAEMEDLRSFSGAQYRFERQYLLRISQAPPRCAAAASGERVLNHALPKALQKRSSEKRCLLILAGSI